MFDRVTGQPVWPIVERPVPTDSDVPGEKPYPTQPFPSKPPAFVDQGVSLEDANDLTPEIKALAQEQMRKFRIGPLFTPPSLEGTLQRPAQAGGGNWGGAAFDPDSGYLFVRAATRRRGQPHREERRIRSAGRGPVFEPCSRQAARTRHVRRPAAHVAAVCRADRGRSEQGRDRVAVPAGRRQPVAAQSSAAEGRQRCRIAWDRRTIAAAPW